MTQLMNQTEMDPTEALNSSLQKDEQHVYSQPEDTFHYKPVPMTAPIGLVLGLLSLTALVGFIGVLVATVGTAVSFLATRKIARSRGMLSGKWLAMTGLVLSSLFLVLGASLQAYAFHTEVPEGYQRISFSQQISKKSIGSIQGKIAFHRDVVKFNNKPIFLKGYMFPQNQVVNLRQFLLLKDTGECCFGGKPKKTDMILITMKEGEPGVKYTDGRVSIAGHFQIRRGKTSDGLLPVYAIDAVMVEPSRTPF